MCACMHISMHACRQAGMHVCKGHSGDAVSELELSIPSAAISVFPVALFASALESLSVFQHVQIASVHIGGFEKHQMFKTTLFVIVVSWCCSYMCWLSHLGRVNLSTRVCVCASAAASVSVSAVASLDTLLLGSDSLCCNCPHQEPVGFGARTNHICVV